MQHAVSVLVGFSNPPTVKVPGYPLKKDDQGLWTVTVGPLNPDLYEQLHGKTTATGEYQSPGDPR
jgi:hypothetical protein